MAQTPGIPWSLPNAGFSIQPVNGEFAAWSQGSSVPPDGWSMDAGAWGSAAFRCQGGTGPWAVDFASAVKQGRIVSDLVVVLPNTKYLLSALYRIVSGSGQALSQGVRVDFYDDSRKLVSSTNLDLIAGTSGTWTYQGMDVVTPTNSVYARVLVGRFNENGSATLQIDAVKFDRSVYIPSGVISLDDITDGVTYARPRGAYMSGGIIKDVLRGAGTIATDFLFKKPNTSDPDTLDGIPNGATYGRPKLDALTVSGYPDMDKVVDGATYARIKGTMLTAGEVTSLSRGGTVYATSTFFQKALDNLGNIQDGGGFRRTADTYVDSSGRVTGVLRGTSQLTGSDLFSKALDSLDNVLDGTTYGRPKLDGLNASGYPLLDKVVDGSLFRKVGVNYVNASGQITAIRNTTTNTDIPGTSVFRRGTDTFTDVAGTIATSQFGAGVVDSNAIGAGAVVEAKLATGAVTNTKIGALAVDSAKLAAAAVTTAKIATGAVTSNELGAAAVTTAKLATGAVTTNELGALAVTTAKIASGAVTTNELGANAVTNAKLASLSVATGNIQTGAVTANELGSGSVTNAKLGLLSVATGNLQDTAITTAKIADLNITNGKVASQAIDWSKLDDGTPIMAWDEGRGSLLAGRVTYTNGGTLQTPEANQGYTSWAVTSGTTDFYVETDIQFRTIKDRFVSITYRTGGTTGWAASSTMLVLNMGNTTQTATATMYGDGLWHTAVFDISAFTGTSTIRFDPQDGGAAIGAGATFWVSNVAVGNIGVGPGGGHTLVSYRGAVGINKAVPGVDLDINGGNSQNVWARLNGFSGIPLFATQRAAGTAAAPTIVTDGTETGRLDFRGYDGSAYRQTAYISSYVNGTPGASDMPGRLVFATTSDGAASATERMQITRDGVVAVNKPTAGGGAAIYINGTDTVYQSITTTSGTVASFPQLQIINYNANGGFPVTAHYNSKGTAASPAALSAGDTLGSVIFYGRGSSTSYAGAEIKAFTSIAPATNISGLLTFSTASAAVSATERMRIDKDGRVSLGGSGNAAVDGSNSYLRTTGDIQVNQATGILSNGYYSGGWKFAANGRATALTFDTGDFIFYSLGNNVAGGPGASATATQRFRVYETGGVQVNNLSGTGNRAVYSDASGILTNTSSDGTLKEDVQSLENVLPVVMKMNPVSFSWKDQERFGPYTEVGFLAQEMLELVPFVIGKNADDTFTIDYPKLTAVLARAIQELKQQVDDLASSRS